MIAAPFLLLFSLPPQTTAPTQANAPTATVASSQSNPPQQSSRSYRISGVIVDAVTGTAVSRAEVSISPSSGDADPRTIDANDGNFSFENVPPGQKYRLSASAPGYVLENYDAHAGFTTAVAVGDGLDAEHIVFRLHPQAVIYGLVSDERGDPVRHARVILLRVPRGRHSPSIFEMQQTNDLGEYRLPHLLPGRYYVAVEASPWYAQTEVRYSGNPNSVEVIKRTNNDPSLDVVYAITFYPSATDESAATELDLAAGEKREANVQLAAVPSAHIHVTNAPTGANSGVGFSLNEKIFGNSIGASSRLSYHQTSPGEYEVSGLPPGSSSLSLFEFGVDGSHRVIQASVDASATIDASAVASSTVNVAGQLVFPDGPPASIPPNVFLSGERDSHSVRAEKDGTFSFPAGQLQPGTYRVNVNVPSSHGDEYVQKISATGATVSGHEIAIDGGATAQLTITVGHGLGQISGAVKVNDKPLPGAMVLLISESAANVEDDYREDQSDSDGTFALRQIIPGKYVLMAIQNGWDLDWTNPQVLAPFREKAQHLNIAPGQSQNLTITAQPASPTPANPPAASPPSTQRFLGAPIS
jgi:hypothetical protein